PRPKHRDPVWDSLWRHPRVFGHAHWLGDFVIPESKLCNHFRYHPAQHLDCFGLGVISRLRADDPIPGTDWATIDRQDSRSHVSTSAEIRCVGCIVCFVSGWLSALRTFYDFYSKFCNAEIL